MLDASIAFDIVTFHTLAYFRVTVGEWIALLYQYSFG
jgi:hypothetical protein